MRPKTPILLVEPLMIEIESRLDAAYRVHRLYDATQRESVEAARHDIRAVVTGGATGLDNHSIDSLPSLGIIAVSGVGTDKIDLAHARSRDIHVTTTPGAPTHDVADMGMALILAVLRRIVEGDEFVRSGRWAKDEKMWLGSSLQDKRLGILGLGQIGRALAARAESFGMRVRYSSRRPVDGATWQYHADALALAADSDILALCAAATPQTRGMVDAAVIGALGPTGVLINIARGALVNEDALIVALQTGAIAGAGLDVFQNEPKIRAEFLALPNVVLIAHQASATTETRLAMGDIVLANLEAYFAGKVPPATVN
jgi:lactate dehydrogenase-like 2-hydroxyacid dehydrogenase